MSGFPWVLGKVRALNSALPFGASPLPLPLPSLVVAFDAAYPSSLVVLRRLDKMEEDMERIEAKRPSSEGKSVVGNGGEEANKEAI